MIATAIALGNYWAIGIPSIIIVIIMAGLIGPKDF